MGKYIKLEELPNKRLAHLIQRLEAKALKAAFAAYSSDIVLLMRDGFVSKRRLDIPLIEQAIHSATRLNLKMEHKQIQLPADFDL